MKSTYTMKCKFCNKNWEFKSSWLPVEIFEIFGIYVIFFHAVFHHPEEMYASRVLYYLKMMILEAFALIALVLLFILRVVLYPLYWLLEKLY